MNSEDEQILLGGEWLNDKIMNACQELIKSNYPQVLGLQDVACGRTLSYEVQTGEFVQIIHTCRQRPLDSNINDRMWQCRSRCF